MVVGIGSFKKEGIYVDLWLIHFVWQKPAHFNCKAIIIQLKIKFKKANYYLLLYTRN